MSTISELHRGYVLKKVVVDFWILVGCAFLLYFNIWLHLRRCGLLFSDDVFTFSALFIDVRMISCKYSCAQYMYSSQVALQSILAASETLFEGQIHPPVWSNRSLLPRSFSDALVPFYDIRQCSDVWSAGS